jgi:uncharacterized membrane protein YciS (DUF1049 family)
LSASAELLDLGPLLPVINAAGILGAMVMAIMWLEGRGRIARLEQRNEILHDKLADNQVKTVQAIHDGADALRDATRTFEEIFNAQQMQLHPNLRGRK